MDALKWVDKHLAGFSKDVKKQYLFFYIQPHQWKELFPPRSVLLPHIRQGSCVWS